MKKILVPYDFSKVAQNALDFALQLGKKSGAEVLMLNVIEHPSASRFKTMGVSEFDEQKDIYMLKLIDMIKSKFETLIQSDQSGVELKYKLQLGNPFKSINDEIAEEDIDIVVMGTMGAEGLDDYFLGSNAEKVVRTSRSPVITLKEKLNMNNINTIAFASNFHELKENFVFKIRELQQLFEAKLRIVKINTPANFTSTRHDTTQMDEFVKKFNLDNFTTSIYNHQNEEDGIIFFAEDVSADLIALGTNQRSGVNHFLTGSIAEDVVNRSTKPVWTLDLD